LKTPTENAAPALRQMDGPIKTVSDKKLKN